MLRWLLVLTLTSGFQPLLCQGWQALLAEPEAIKPIWKKDAQNLYFVPYTGSGAAPRNFELMS
jgi:hypothetical protein